LTLEGAVNGEYGREENGVDVVDVVGAAVGAAGDDADALSTDAYYAHGTQDHPDWHQPSYGPVVQVGEPQKKARPEAEGGTLSAWGGTGGWNETDA
jgi:hypothetical protein